MRKSVCFTLVACLVSAIVLMAACGGGGGGGGDLADLPGTYELSYYDAIIYTNVACSNQPGSAIANSADGSNYGDWIIGDTETDLSLTAMESSVVQRRGPYTAEGDADAFLFTISAGEFAPGALPLVGDLAFNCSLDLDGETIIVYGDTCYSAGGGSLRVATYWEKISDNTDLPVLPE